MELKDEVLANEAEALKLQEILEELKKEEDTDYNPLSEPFIDDDIKSIIVESPDFLEGLKRASYLGGIFTGLVNSGMDVIICHEIVNNECVAMNNIAMGKLQLEIAKYNYNNKESQEI